MLAEAPGGRPDTDHERTTQLRIIPPSLVFAVLVFASAIAGGGTYWP
jgi:hypothetical protein